MAIVVGFAVAILVLFLFSFLLSNSRRQGHGGLPPSPRPLPVIGNLFDVESAWPRRSFARLARIYGPLMLLRLGAVTTVVVSSPSISHDKLQKYDAVLAARYNPNTTTALGYHAVSVAWLPPRSQWQFLRRICSVELFSPQRLNLLQWLQQEKVRQLVDHIARLLQQDAAAEINRLVFTTNLNLL